MVFYFCLRVAESCEARYRMDKASSDHAAIVKTSQS